MSPSNDNWKAIPNFYLSLSFLLNCNYDVKYLNSNRPLFYREVLRFFYELRINYEAPLKRELILWNNKGILIDKQPVFWKSRYDQKVIFINDL